MSDPHSPRPQETVAYPDVVRTALGLMRSAVLSGESWSVELAAAYEDAVDALPAADPAASAETDAAWEALWESLRTSAFTAEARVAYDKHRPLIEAALGEPLWGDAGDWTAADAILEVLTNEGWVADPDATDYNLRVAALIEAALAAGTVSRAVTEGLADVAAGRTRPWADVRAAIRSAGTPPASREPLDDLRESHRHIRRAGFPEHRPDVECYCDTCWGYLADEAGGDPERRANDAS